MIQWVYESAQKSNVSSRIIIATPDEEILSVSNGFGAEGIKTSSTHESGTDRLAEVAKSLNLTGLLLNVQGDEPLIPPEAILHCANLLQQDLKADMSSLFTDVVIADVENPAVVKVVIDLEGFALYFSRYPIPFFRSEISAEERAKSCKRHIGIYGFRTPVLLSFSGWARTELEQAESLEQLRFLEHGIKIKMGYSRPFPTGVDTPEQANEVRKILRSNRG